MIFPGLSALSPACEAVPLQAGHNQIDTRWLERVYRKVTRETAQPRKAVKSASPLLAAFRITQQKGIFMARARNIKPDFFTDEEVVELQPLTRLMFIGMWTLADRQGRMEDRPKQIKLRLLPVDDLSVDGALDELQEHKFIVRYEVNGKRYIQIRNFLKHQSPHRDEKDSILPAYSEQAPCTHDANTVQAPCTHDAKRPDCLNLIADSLNLIPEEKKQADKTVSISEKQIRVAIEERRDLIARKFPNVDIEIEVEEMVAKCRGQSLGVDPWVFISRWLKNIQAGGNNGTSHNRSAGKTRATEEGIEASSSDSTAAGVKDFACGFPDRSDEWGPAA